MTFPEFRPFTKIPRWNRDVLVTEKIDGTNAQIIVNDTGDDLCAASRTRLITPGVADNFGFAAWVMDNKAELLKLGPGHHFGEWYGYGIQRGYGLANRRFALFNVTRWSEERPSCCDVVPVLWAGLMQDFSPDVVLGALKLSGSRAAPGFMSPEGIIVLHKASNQLFKMTLERDSEHKGG